MKISQSSKKENLVIRLLGVALLLSGISGFLRYGIESAHYYLSSMINLNSILLGLWFLTDTMPKYRGKNSIANHWLAKLIVGIYAVLMAYTVYLWALDSGSIWAYTLLLLLVIFSINRFAASIKTFLKK